MDNTMTILFLCTGNACRSQMAEAWTRNLYQDRYQVFSAGVLKTRVDPVAMKVMAEEGVDMSGYYSKLVEELPEKNFDLVITLCSHANANCPFFPGRARKIHRGFDDPPSLALQASDEEEALFHYRRVRDEIKAFVKTLPHIINPD